jgi:hypothetical protein
MSVRAQQRPSGQRRNASAPLRSRFSAKPLTAQVRIRPLTVVVQALIALNRARQQADRGYPRPGAKGRFLTAIQRILRIGA